MITKEEVKKGWEVAKTLIESERQIRSVNREIFGIFRWKYKVDLFLQWLSRKFPTSPEQERRVWARILKKHNEQEEK